MKYIRYRFYTKSVDDPRPLIDLKGIGMPYWVSGYSGDMSAAIIVCYLPVDTDLFQYWDDAYDIDKQEKDEITYTDRFPKPKWLP